MGRNKYQILFWLAFGLILTLLASPPATAQGSLPPRHTLSSGGDEGSGGDQPVGAHIELYVGNAPAGSWAVVQWLDSSGTWRDIEGWRGVLDLSNRSRWWVASKDFGSGPYQWKVVQGPYGQTLATSEQFNLPLKIDETKFISVTVRPAAVPVATVSRPVQKVLPTSTPWPSCVQLIQASAGFTQVSGCTTGGASLPIKQDTAVATARPAVMVSTPTGDGADVPSALPVSGGGLVLKVGLSELLVFWVLGVSSVLLAAGTWLVWRRLIGYISGLK